jgi:cytosine/adenosine deaminase-related metal-dependent hydrolase
MAMAAEDLARAGVAAVGDVSNTLASASPLAGAALAGTIFHEVFGVTGPRLEAARAAAREARARLGAAPPGLRVVESPHAVYSTLPAALRELLRAGPGSIHLAEDPAERELCAAGTGPFARMRRALGGDAPPPRARSAVAVVADDLAPHHLAVHCVDVDGDDLALLARSGATAVLCPRSNRFIGGALPPLPRLLAAGIPLAVGTDSLASSPSLDPLAELRVLREAFPEVPPARLLALAWNGACVGAPHVGRLSAGAAPGVLAAPLGGAEVRDPFAWLLDGFEGRFAWIARQRGTPA